MAPVVAEAVQAGREAQPPRPAATAQAEAANENDPAQPKEARKTNEVQNDEEAAQAVERRPQAEGLDASGPSCRGGVPHHRLLRPNKPKQQQVDTKQRLLTTKAATAHRRRCGLRCGCQWRERARRGRIRQRVPGFELGHGLNRDKCSVRLYASKRGEVTFIIKKPIAHTIRATPSVTTSKVKTNVSAKHAALVKNKHRKPEDHALAVSGVCVTETPPHGPMRGNTMHSLTCKPEILFVFVDLVARNRIRILDFEVPRNLITRSD